MDDLANTLAAFLIWVPPIILAITFHEAAHGFAANHYGDDTAKKLGRLTLNPIAHIDRFGTVILPAILYLLPGGFIFGYAKPVPVQVSQLNDPRWDMAKVALAGPGMNFVLAIGSALLMPLAIMLPVQSATILLKMLDISIFFNILLGVFNLLPLPPLDGGRVLVALLPYNLARKVSAIEPMGIFVVLGFFFLVPKLFESIGIQFSPFELLVLDPTTWFAKTLVDLVL